MGSEVASSISNYIADKNTSVYCQLFNYDKFNMNGFIVIMIMFLKIARS